MLKKGGPSTLNYRNIVLFDAAYKITGYCIEIKLEQYQHEFRRNSSSIEPSKYWITFLVCRFQNGM